MNLRDYIKEECERYFSGPGHYGVGFRINDVNGNYLFVVDIMKEDWRNSSDKKQFIDLLLLSLGL